MVNEFQRITTNRSRSSAVCDASSSLFVVCTNLSSVRSSCSSNE